MTKEEWQKLYDILKIRYSEFLAEYPKIKNGKNDKIRKAALSNVNNEIDLCCNWIYRYYEAYSLLTGENFDDYAKSVNWGEFKESRFFINDMKEFLAKIKVKISSFDE
jgi:hypothetical protein